MKVNRLERFRAVLKLQDPPLSLNAAARQILHVSAPHLSRVLTGERDISSRLERRIVSLIGGEAWRFVVGETHRLDVRP